MGLENLAQLLQVVFQWRGILQEQETNRCHMPMLGVVFDQSYITSYAFFLHGGIVPLRGATRSYLGFFTLIGGSWEELCFVDEDRV